LHNFLRRPLIAAIPILIAAWALPMAAQAHSNLTSARPSAKPAPMGIVPFRGGLGAASTRTRGLPRFTPYSQDPMIYHGGPIMHTVVLHPIYWAPGGYAFPAGYQTITSTFLADVAAASGSATNVMATTTQYWDDQTGASPYDIHFAGALVDAHPFPASGCTVHAGDTKCVTDQQMQAELLSFLAGQGLSSSASDFYLLYTPPAVNTCVDAASTICSYTARGYCGYHSSIAIPNAAPLLYTHLPFEDPAGEGAGCRLTDGTNENYPEGRGSGDYAVDVAISVTSHELAETITDPRIDANGYGSGWTDTSGNSGEIGDKCAYTFGTPIGSLGGLYGDYNQAVNGHAYWTQEEWSNNPFPGYGTQESVTANCLQGYSNGFRAVVSASPLVATAGQTETFDASHSVDPAGTVTTYLWDFGDGTQQTTTTPAVTHTFTATTLTNGGQVQVFETDNHGATAYAARAVTVASPLSITLATAPGTTVAAGSHVSFTASGFSDPNGGSLASASWSFGDGQSGSGLTPTHVYPQSGTYLVSLTVTDSLNVQGTVQVTLTVTPIAVVHASRRKTSTGSVVAFDGRASHSPGRSISSWKWRFSDATTSTGARVRHAFYRSGRGCATLTVTDSRGIHATTTVCIQVALAKPRVTGFGIGQTVASALHKGAGFVVAPNEQGKATILVGYAGRVIGGGHFSFAIGGPYLFVLRAGSLRAAGVRTGQGTVRLRVVVVFTNPKHQSARAGFTITLRG
jgi:PKD repeat protein